MVISWILSSVSDPICKSVLFVDSAHEMWLQSERRFALSNGSRKYQLNKDLYALKRNGSSINDYYTRIHSFWEELDSMSSLPKVSVNTAEISQFLKALSKEKEQQRLSQFLNGMDSGFNPHRSQLLMLNPFPTVEVACSVLSRKKSKRLDIESSAMYSKGQEVEKCSACGEKGHNQSRQSRCWTVIGYPAWNSKSKVFPQKSVPPQRNKGVREAYPTHQQKWNKGKGNSAAGHRSAANANTHNKTNEFSNGAGITFTPRQFEQLLKFLPSSSKSNMAALETDDEVEADFAGIVFCINASAMIGHWIIDSGASDHMTCSLNKLSDINNETTKSRINLPYGHTSDISHKGTITLSNNLVLKEVLYVPTFKHNLLSITKLRSDNDCFITFTTTFASSRIVQQRRL